MVAVNVVGFLRGAAKTSFNTVESIGILLALALIAVLTRYSLLDSRAIDRVVTAMANLVVAALLLGYRRPIFGASDLAQTALTVALNSSAGGFIRCSPLT